MRQLENKNAGIILLAPIEAVTEDQFDHLYKTNLKGPLFTLQKLIPVLAEGAKVVVNASNLAGLGVSTTRAYAATKGALVSLTHALAAKLLPKGIRINAVAPVPIERLGTGKLGMSKDQLTSTIWMGRIGQADEVAKAAPFLVSDASSFMTGEISTLDGAWSSL